MRKVQGASFPRSGHGLLVRHLKAYFSAEMPFIYLPNHYLERPNLVKGRFSGLVWRAQTLRERLTKKDKFFYCEYYAHYRQSPCIDTRTTLQKNHDRQLDVAIDPQRYYLVQIRQPLPAIISWYELAVRKGWRKLTDDRETWASFFEDGIGFYERFFNKWAMAGETENRKIIWYEDYMNSPFNGLKKVVCFFNEGQSVNEDRLKAIVRDVQRTRNITAFKYYDESLEERVANLSIRDSEKM